MIKNRTVRKNRTVVTLLNSLIVQSENRELNCHPPYRVTFQFNSMERTLTPLKIPFFFDGKMTSLFSGQEV